MVFPLADAGWELLRGGGCNPVIFTLSICEPEWFLAFQRDSFDLDSVSFLPRSLLVFIWDFPIHNFGTWTFSIISQHQELKSRNTEVMGFKQLMLCLCLKVKSKRLSPGRLKWDERDRIPCLVAVGNLTRSSSGGSKSVACHQKETHHSRADFEEICPPLNKNEKQQLARKTRPDRSSHRGNRSTKRHCWGQRQFHLPYRSLISFIYT